MQRFGGDLGHSRAEPLAHVRTRYDHAQAAIALQCQLAGTVIREDALADADILEAAGHAPSQHPGALGILPLVFLQRLPQLLLTLVL